jgi:hypothetical protein
MLKNVSKKLFILSAVAGISAQTASAFTYIAKKGDTLSDVLYKNDYKPIYGRGGSLEQTLKINPDIKYEKGNKIFPGTKIVLSGSIVHGNYVLRSTGKKIVVESVVEKNEPVVIPEAAPVVDHAREVSDIFDQVFFWQLSPSVSWKELTAKDSNINQNSNATALSDMSYGATVVYGMRFNPDMDIYSKLFLEAVNFSSDNSINVVKKNIVTSSLGAGFFYKKKWQVEAGMGDELFLTSPNATSVEIKKVSMPYLKSAYKNEFYQFQEASLLYALSGKILLPRSASGIDPKLSYGAGAGIEAKLRNQSFYLGYEKTILKASGNSTDGQNIFWRYTWETP